LPGDVVRERIENHPVNIRNRQVPGEPLAPHTGYSFGAAAPQTTCWRQGLKGPPHGGTPSSPLSPPHALTRGRQRGRSAVSPATHTVGGPGTTRPMPSHEGNWPSHHPHTRAVRDTRRPPHRTSGTLMVLGRVPAQPHPRTPAPINVNLGAPGRYPGDGICVYGLRFSLSSSPSALLLSSGRA
jgi:hypothetical protein